MIFNADWILRSLVLTSLFHPNGTTYAIDPFIAGVMLIRKDVTVEDWSYLKTDQHGIKATKRFGLAISAKQRKQKRPTRKPHCKNMERPIF